MSDDYPEGNELDCYEASEARECGGTIHLGMDATQNEDQRTYWNVFVPAIWDNGQRLILLTKDEFEVIGGLLNAEFLASPSFSPLRGEQMDTVANLVGKKGAFGSLDPQRYCPECSTFVIPLGDNHWVCDKCAVTLDDDGEIVALIEDEEWVEMDTQTLEFDDALGIVRNEAMQVIAFPDWLASQMTLDGDHFELKDTVEVAQAYEDHGGANHSNHDDFDDGVNQWYNETAGKSG